MKPTRGDLIRFLRKRMDEQLSARLEALQKLPDPLRVATDAVTAEVTQKATKRFLKIPKVKRFLAALGQCNIKYRLYTHCTKHDPESGKSTVSVHLSIAESFDVDGMELLLTVLQRQQLREAKQKSEERNNQLAVTSKRLNLIRNCYDPDIIGQTISDMLVNGDPKITELAAAVEEKIEEAFAKFNS